VSKCAVICEVAVCYLAVLAYCSYNVGKHYLSAYKDYKKSKATLQTDKSLEENITGE